jgi:hypothetical protein
MIYGEIVTRTIAYGRDSAPIFAWVMRALTGFIGGMIPNRKGVAAHYS